MAPDVSSEARELNLVSKVEMRIALASSDTQLQTLLTTYLPPLLLKLGSAHVSVRNKVIAICQHVNKMLESSSGLLVPVMSLLKQFRGTDSNLVKHFDLIYLEQGLKRIDVKDGVEMLPEVLKLSSDPSLRGAMMQSRESLISYDKVLVISRHFLLRLLPTWALPEREGKEDVALRNHMALTEDDAAALASYLSDFLRWDGKSQATAYGSLDQNSTAPTQQGFFPSYAESPALLSQTKIAAAKFLFTSVFTDMHRFVPAVVLSSDSTNLTAFRIGDMMFKQCTFDLESQTNVENLYELYFGSAAEGPTKPRLKMRILALLSKSKLATTYPHRVLTIVEQQLYSADGSAPVGLEATKLRAAIFSYLNWVVRIGSDRDLLAIAPYAQQSLQKYIGSQGWPSPDTTGNGLSQPELDLRSKAYESIGVLAAKRKPGIDLVDWLFTSLRCDISGSHINVSIEEALGRVLNSLATMSIYDDVNGIQRLKGILLRNMTAEMGVEDPEYGCVTRRSARYAAVRYANRCLPFENVDARWIALLATADNVGSTQEVIEEGSKGLDPFWHEMARPRRQSSLVKNQPHELAFPDFSNLVRKFFGTAHSLQLSDAHPHSMGPAVSLSRNTLVAEALRGTEYAIIADADWERGVDALLSSNEMARATVRRFLRDINPKDLVLLLEAAIDGMSSGSG